MSKFAKSTSILVPFDKVDVPRIALDVGVDALGRVQKFAAHAAVQVRLCVWLAPHDRRIAELQRPMSVAEFVQSQCVAVGAATVADVAEVALVDCVRRCRPRLRMRTNEFGHSLKMWSMYEQLEKRCEDFKHNVISHDE